MSRVMARVVGVLVMSLFVFSMIGCAVPSLPPSATALSSQAQEMTGRFVVNLEQEGQKQSTHGKFRWLSLPEREQFEIFSPFGQSQMRVSMKDEQMTLEIPGQSPYVGEAAQVLLQKNLGFDLPFNDFLQWLRRQPGKHSPATFERTAGNQIAVIHQNGWVIEYLEPEIETVHRINLKYPAHELELKLVIDAAGQGVGD